MVRLACRGGAHVWQVGTVVRFLRGGLAPKSGMHAVLGRRQSSVAASLARHDRVVAADLRVAKGRGGGHGLCAARQWGLVRLEGWSEKERKKRKEINITLLACPRMGQWRWRDLRGLRGEAWWRGGGFENLACGEKRSLQH